MKRPGIASTFWFVAVERKDVAERVPSPKAIIGLHFVSFGDERLRSQDPLSIKAQVDGSGTPATKSVVVKAYVYPNASLLLIVSPNRRLMSVTPFEYWPRLRTSAVKKACAEARLLKD